MFLLLVCHRCLLYTSGPPVLAANIVVLEARHGGGAGEPPIRRCGWYTATINATVEVEVKPHGRCISSFSSFSFFYPIFPPTATTRWGFARGTTLLRPLPHLAPGSIRAASCTAAGGGGLRGTSPDNSRNGWGIGGMIRSPFWRLSEDGEVHARKWIQGLIKRVAKILTPNKDSDKRRFGRCVVKNGIIL